MNVLRKIFRIVIYTFIVLFVVFIALYLLTGGPWEVPKTVEQDPNIPHIVADGITFHSEVYGADTLETLIVVHGGPGNDYRYLLPLSALSDRYRVIFYDQRGTGLSPRVESSQLTLESSIMDLDRVINYYAAGEKVHIFGHSWGAMLATAYLGRYPGKVDRIVLAEPGFLTSEMSEIFYKRTNGFRVEMTPSNLLLMGKVVFRALHVRGPDRWAMKDFIFSSLITADIKDHPMSGYFCDDKKNPSAVVFWRLGMDAAQTIPQSQMDADGNIQIDLVKNVDQYPDTVLLIAGSCNRLIGPDYQTMHLKYFPRVKMKVIDNAGHFMFIDQPETFFRIV